ncbi:outer membrane protein assembly factor BamD [Thermosulfurimonas marina]|uniref:Outer membrane protein assembly factor BamD n=1 Tax=Thermosulfurimonas marina TaxID=2047767 RepID=A0A6H1WQJ7_9BACT|nr:outer membrane protein assembly factor BamD [Thermosulfurimonas marina]QJA05472.1 outer membrane protein assembly factor BamD [Thermosulfurimonas marina]
MRRLLIFGILLLFFLPACGPREKGTGGLLSWFAKKPQPAEAKLRELVERAQRHFERGYYELAEKDFEEIRDRYPDSPYALWAELKLADCKFFAGKYLEAVVLYQEFEKLHPTNEAVPYVIFQIGTCYYRLMLSPDRDQTNTRKAIEAYERLIKTYPDAPYVYEARRRIARARERLAEHELYVARFYYRTGGYRAAYYRLLYLLDNYPETRAAAKARRLVYTYYRKAQEETRALAEGRLKDFWGQPYP